MRKSSERRRIYTAPVAGALIVLYSSPALAEEDAKRPAAEAEDVKRPIPDYDGRPDPPTTVGQGALWVPRVVFFPVYLVSEYVLRRPLGWMVSRAEEEKLAQRLAEIFTFGPRRTMTLLPIALVDFGFQPSVGLLFLWNEFLSRNNSLRARFSTWGPDWISAVMADEIESSDKMWALMLRGEATLRPDGLFYGIGQGIDDDLKSRYDQHWYEGTLRGEMRLHPVTLGAFAGLRSVTFGNDTCCSGPPVSERVAMGQFAAFPPGFEGYFVYRNGLAATFDSRDPRPAPGSGVRLRLEGSYSIDLEHPHDRSWVTYGGSLGGFIDVTGLNHVFSLTLYSFFADAIRGAVPFTELTFLSGYGPLQGFVGNPYSNRLIGQSATAALLEYRWPIWVWLDGSMHFAVGDVFDEHLSDFQFGRLRMSFGAGIRTAGSRDTSLEMLLAFGTDHFDSGPNVESIRFVVGANRAF